MLSFLLGISIKFERNAFKVEKSKKVLGTVCKSDLFWALCFLPSWLIPSILTAVSRETRPPQAESLITIVVFDI
jgi:hypothetical protein